ncbi:MAG: plasmid maintenance system antidote protein VapI [Psychroserpens sp.]|jgi:plasmid maintenance system antidote protein VapI
MKDLTDISQTQQERLIHIDIRVRFQGMIKRDDLVVRFGISKPAATRDLALYKTCAPDNLIFDGKLRAYRRSKYFKPFFDYPDSQAMSAICEGLGDDQVIKISPLIQCETPIALNTPNIDTLSLVTQAIHQSLTLAITYHSMSSGETQREIVPFSLVDNGRRWHVRAFDKRNNRFADFVINRIEKARLLTTTIEPEQTKEYDHQWNRMVELHIVPHPKVKYPKTVEVEYFMDKNGMRCHVRAAVAGYVLRHWNVDCSPEHSLASASQLRLSNIDALYGVEQLILAPGYHMKRSPNLPCKHPSNTFKTRCLEKISLPITEVANRLNIDISQLNLFLDEKLSIDEVFSRKLEVATGISAGFWLNLQKQYDDYIESKLDTGAKSLFD